MKAAERQWERERADKLKAIVKALAEKDPMDSEYNCMLCRAWLGPLYSQMDGQDLAGKHRGEEHRPDCTWVRARKALGMDA